MTAIITEIAVIFLLFAANGVFAMTEIAVVSAANRGSGDWQKKMKPDSSTHPAPAEGKPA